MKKLLRSLCLLLLSLFCLTLFLTACGEKTEPSLSPEEIAEAYEARGYEVIPLDPADDSSDLPYRHSLMAAKAEESVYFYFFEAREDAEKFKEESEWNLLLWFYSWLYNDPTWVKVEQYGNLVVSYESKDTIQPLKELLTEAS